MSLFCKVFNFCLFFISLSVEIYDCYEFHTEQLNRVEVKWRYKRSECVCGEENNSNISTRIVGGTVVDPPHRYPWLVALADNDGVFCGAVLLNSDYLLTAAHCVNSRNDGTYNALIGAHNLDDNPMRYVIDQTIVHTGFDERSLRDDIALLKLKPPVRYKKQISPICLLSQSEYELSRLTVAGWGITETGGFTTKVPHEVNVPIVTNQQCKSAYASIDDRRVVTDNNVCAGAEDKDACKGDSGGPLFTKDKKINKILLVGISSFGNGCGRKEFPGVYVRVSKYIDWILRETKGSSFCRPPSPQGPIQPNFANCGIANENGIKRVKRIVNGYETMTLEYPWTVAISYQKVLIGTGVLISDNFILTAVSTFEKFMKRPDYKQSLFRLFIGAHDITKREVNKISCTVTNIYIHELYNNPAYDYNFALMSFECPPNKFDSSLYRPICLPRSTNEYKIGAKVIIAGWGKTGSGTPGSKTLRKTTVELLDDSRCKRYYGSSFTPRMLCFSTASSDACDGDDGGPVMYSYSGRYYLMAIIWYYKCANSRNPAKNGDVRKVLNWITSVTKVPIA